MKIELLARHSRIIYFAGASSLYDARIQANTDVYARISGRCLYIDKVAYWFSHKCNAWNIIFNMLTARPGCYELTVTEMEQGQDF